MEESIEYIITDNGCYPRPSDSLIESMNNDKNIPEERRFYFPNGIYLDKDDPIVQVFMWKIIFDI